MNKSESKNKTRASNIDPPREPMSPTSFHLFIKEKEKFMNNPIRKTCVFKISQTHTHTHPPNNLVVMWLQEITDQPKYKNINKNGKI